MGMHPLNLALRFGLELCGLVALARCGWSSGRGGLRYVFALVFPLLAIILWVVFAVPDDPSRSGSAPVPIVGWLRLILEAVFFLTSIYGLFVTTNSTWAMVYLSTVLFHYAISYERIAWLLQH